MSRRKRDAQEILPPPVRVVAIAALAILILIPIAYTLLLSVTPDLEIGVGNLIPSHWAFGNYLQMWSTVNLAQGLSNSLIIAGIASVIAVIRAAGAARDGGGAGRFLLDGLERCAVRQRLDVSGDANAGRAVASLQFGSGRRGIASVWSINGRCRRERVARSDFVHDIPEIPDRGTDRRRGQGIDIMATGDTRYGQVSSLPIPGQVPAILACMS